MDYCVNEKSRQDELTDEISSELSRTIVPCTVPARRRGVEGSVVTATAHDDGVLYLRVGDAV
jgi:hypothetical protein